MGSSNVAYTSQRALLVSLCSLLFYVPLAFSNLYVTYPYSGISCTGGSPCTVTWIDDGTSPSLSQLGTCDVTLHEGAGYTLVQQIASSLNVASVDDLTFTPNPSAGANGDDYYIEFDCSSSTSAYSGFFTLNGMSGTEGSPVGSLTSSLASSSTFAPGVSTNATTSSSSSTSTTSGSSTTTTTSTSTKTVSSTSHTTTTTSSSSATSTGTETTTETSTTHTTSTTSQAGDKSTSTGTTTTVSSISTSTSTKTSGADRRYKRVLVQHAHEQFGAAGALVSSLVFGGLLATVARMGV